MTALDGKVAIVTGAGRGIGRDEALALAAEGAKVVVNDFDESLAKDVVAEIAAAGGTAITNGSDVASWPGAEAMVRHAVEELGGLDILVNNAGFLRDQIGFKMTEENFDDVVRVHLKVTSHRRASPASTGAISSRRATSRAAPSSTP